MRVRRRIPSRHGIRCCTPLATTAAVTEPKARALPHTLATVYALGRLDREAGRLIRDGLIDARRFDLLDDTLDARCDDLAAHTDTLVEAFGYPQVATRAPMGRPGGYATHLANELSWARRT
ncbi:acyl-CoA dehydrogenase [Embleya sp. MST-111070]|uniref:acyl-CoA dehydrogenase n=1 Tax=Embleya sp. MST-111070 TaxID=3398231 RepID=UPI003F731945